MRMSYYRFKTCIFGDGGVGKTTLVNRYVTGRYQEDFKMTIGVDFYTKGFEIDDNRVQLQIWDFGGEHQFKNLLPNYVIGASGGIFMYDISRFSSLTNIDEWLKVLKKNPEVQKKYMPILLVGGKIDLELEGKRVVEKEYAQEFGKKYNLFDCIECSSVSGENVEFIFETIARKMIALSDSVQKF
ncbi:MAG: GTP-binding protein [Promethearchaeota archaeon]|nr:MAG: GTP-binding protein [Candidatus Lokiarchaeota archaeon]